jgi:dienelactone hydrolase
MEMAHNQALPRLVEYPAFFPAGDETLFGIFSTAAEVDPSPAVVMLGGGGTTPTVSGRNRFYVDLCRRLASHGFGAFRFDYHGLGDSTGSGEFRLDRPYLDDLAGVIRWLSLRGVSRYILVGSCFGARTALAGAPSIDGLEGLVLLAPPVRDFGLSEQRTEGWKTSDFVMAALHPERLLGRDEKVTLRRYVRFLGSGLRVTSRRLRESIPGRPNEPSWVSRRFLEPLAWVARTELPTLLVYGAEDEELRDFETARQGRVGRILTRPNFEVRTLPGQVHGFTRVDSQGPTADVIIDWIASTASAGR